MKKCRAIIININIVINSVTFWVCRHSSPHLSSPEAVGTHPTNRDGNEETPDHVLLGVLLFPLLFSEEVGGGTNRKTGATPLALLHVGEQD